MNEAVYDFGMIGLGTMGRNLLLNIADHGFAAIGFDRDASKGQLLESSATQGTKVKAAPSLKEMIDALKPPRRIMMLVPAGPIVDSVINELLPLVSPGDIIIDGGNSHYTDTLKRMDALKGKQIHFIGMGVSGGEQGARTGPSIMPGGDQQAWQELKPVLEAVSAKVDGQPCVAYMGKGAAGHYVKMVHNGIEYALMQIISEVYDLLKRGFGYDNRQVHDLFSNWNKGPLQSFLIEITSTVFEKKDEGSNKALVDLILDKAGSKGTGKWTSQDAMDIPVSIPSIDMAVAMRDLSTYKDERLQAAETFKPVVKPIRTINDRLLKQLEDALHVASVVCYAQGLAMLSKASDYLQMEIPLPDVVRIWRGGCIIRSASLELFMQAYKKEKKIPNVLLNKKVAAIVKKKQPALRKIIQVAINAHIPVNGLMSTLGYLDAYTSAQLPVNLIQAQRDMFGAHGYQRIDKEGNFHTEWNS